jgi:hypothetical protein
MNIITIAQLRETLDTAKDLSNSGSNVGMWFILLLLLGLLFWLLRYFLNEVRESRTIMKELFLKSDATNIRTVIALEKNTEMFSRIEKLNNNKE